LSWPSQPLRLSRRRRRQTIAAGDGLVQYQQKDAKVIII